MAVNMPGFTVRTLSFQLLRSLNELSDFLIIAYTVKRVFYELLLVMIQ